MFTLTLLNISQKKREYVNVIQIRIKRVDRKPYFVTEVIEETEKRVARRLRKSPKVAAERNRLGYTGTQRGIIREKGTSTREEPKENRAQKKKISETKQSRVSDRPESLYRLNAAQFR